MVVCRVGRPELERFPPRPIVHWDENGLFFLQFEKPFLPWNDSETRIEALVCWWIAAVRHRFGFVALSHWLPAVFVSSLIGLMEQWSRKEFPLIGKLVLYEIDWIVLGWIEVCVNDDPAWVLLLASAPCHQIFEFFSC